MLIVIHSTDVSLMRRTGVLPRIPMEFLPLAATTRLFWLNVKAALNRAITPRSIVFVRMCLTEPITSHLTVFSFRAHASVQLANEPRKEDSADSFPLAVFRSQCLVVREADQAASVPEETLLSGTSFLAYEWSVYARLYSKYSVCNVCLPTTFQTCICLTCQASESTTLRFDGATTTERERAGEAEGVAATLPLLQNIVLSIWDVFCIFARDVLLLWLSGALPLLIFRESPPTGAGASWSVLPTSSFACQAFSGLFWEGLNLFKRQRNGP